MCCKIYSKLSDFCILRLFIRAALEAISAGKDPEQSHQLIRELHKENNIHVHIHTGLPFEPPHLPLVQ
ncbi:hypothetical protein AMECASPLE_003364 [Ameca splendens]|uniref:Uncharacterized protein n=1 Tax=Ameca splendens TaxID=208324 RepID=A0ABV1A672_9TELE